MTKINIIRVFHSLIAIASLGGILVGVASLVPLKAFQPSPKAPVPYTVMLQEARIKADGSLENVGTTTWAVRSDGSRVMRVELPGHLQRTIEAVTDKTRTTVLDSTGRKSTRPRAFADPRRYLRDPGSNCLSALTGRTFTEGETIVGKEQTSGYRSVQIQTGNETTWYALDYGCAMLQARFAVLGKPVQQKTLVYLLPGEPSSDLFSIPASYVEVPPSGLKNCAKCAPSNVAARADQEYLRLHAGSPAN